MDSQFIKIKTYRGEVFFVNTNHIISIRPVKEVYHVSLTDFGFDISRDEYENIIKILGFMNLN